MSRLSPGSTATTSLFMVLTLLALAALMLRDATPPPTCDERLIRMGRVSWDPKGAIPRPGEVHAVTYTYTVNADGTLSDIALASSPTPYDTTALQALKRARYAADDESQLCTYTFMLRLD